MIKCPKCGGNTENCSGHGHYAKLNVYRRRKVCLECGERITTYEIILTPSDMRALGKAMQASEEVSEPEGTE